ncbi:MAG: imidazole glycerol phosphate synthase subunit HisH [Rickettsiales bacterium]
MPGVTIADYGSSNLLSVVRAFHHLGAEVETATTADEIRAAEIVVVPGVGAFGDCVNGLVERGLAEAVCEHVRSGGAFLGICVGMQMMFESSSEFGIHEGLGLIAGSVEPIPPTGADGSPHKIPHIGWNTLARPDGVDWEETILRGLPEDPAVYFVHSFAGKVAVAGNLIADADYDGRRITAAVRTGNAYGVQFHPEKSGETGLQILKNFLEGAA